MNENKDQWIEVPLHRVGKSTRSGDVYPEHILRDAIEKLAEGFQGRRLFGEVSNPVPSQRETPEQHLIRMNTVDAQRVTHEIDPASIQIRDNMVFGKVRPFGPNSHVLMEMLSKGELSFALRAFISYEQGHTTQAKNLTVDRCTIVTFDLTYLPL